MLTQNITPLERTQGIIPSARQHNQIVEAVERLNGSVQPGRQIFGEGVIFTPIYGGQFKVVEIFGDYISANPWNGTAANTDQTFYIAKPYLMRNSITSRNGKTYSGFTNASGEQLREDDTDGETQVVISTYVTGDVIYAETGFAGGTGVYYTVAGVDYPVIWLDINNDGRKWSKKSGT